MRKVAAMFWCAQVDAAAKDDAEVNSGGGALKQGSARKTKKKGPKGKKGNDLLGLFIRQGTCVRRENQGTVGLETKLSP